MGQQGSEQLIGLHAVFGAFLMGAHLGSFEVMHSLGRQRGGLDVVMAMYEDNARRINAILAAINPRAKAEIVTGAGWITVFHDGLRYDFHLVDDLAVAEGEHASAESIIAPMPGKVLSVEVAAGQTVTKGQRLLVLEAMKMEHALVAPFDGTVAELSAVAGGQVQVEALLLRIEASE